MWGKSRPNLGLLLLAVWLIITGLRQVIDLSFTGLNLITAVLAIAAGALLILGR